jgi:3-methyladenine DNA glycosylase/8-oxoguanine DNA glycosylase
MRATAERWAPYRSHATLLLWEMYEDGDADPAAFAPDRPGE